MFGNFIFLKIISIYKNKKIEVYIINNLSKFKG